MVDLAAQRQKFFQGRRDDASRQANANGQEQSEAINRRMASIGQSGSGAAIGAQLKANDVNEAGRRSAMNDIAGQELQAMEPDAQREFQAGESALSRNFQSGLADKDQVFKQGMFNTEQGNKLKEMDLAERQFAIDKDTTEFNKRMAELEANKQDPGLLGQGGFMGTGINGTGGALDALKSPMSIIAAPFAGGGGVKCFLTTAATEAMGLPDDCWVLEEARRFRDTYMVQNAERAQQIMTYYDIAPKVVTGINALSDPKRIWKQFFWQDIIPFVDAVSNNDMEVAHKRYLALIERAKIRAEIKEK